MASLGMMVGTAVTAFLVLFAVLFFFQTKDPMVLVFAVQLSVALWVVILILHVLRRGIPVRIVADEREKP